MPPAKTGKDKTNKKTDTIILQTKSLTFSNVTSTLRKLKKVTIKLIPPKIEEAPAKCKLKIAKSTQLPECPKDPDKGGYTVHPVPTPLSIIEDKNKHKIAGGNNQNLKLFKRGKLISGQESIKGKNQLPKPPINTGITIKKIIERKTFETFPGRW